MDERSLDQRLKAMAALGDPLRRALYRLVADRHAPVSRDQAAEAVGCSRSAAALHLDRLVDEGLLDTEFRRLGPRRGPGAGRPAKLYRRAQRELAVTLPPRHYDLAADLLATAVTAATREATAVDQTVRRVAYDRGVALATAATNGGRDPVGAVADVLTDQGYEPVVDDGGVVLSNCPFHALVGDHAELVCGMNLALLEGVVAGLAPSMVHARLEPEAGGCCVRLVATSEEEAI